MATISLRCSEEEKEIFKQAAEMEGLDLSKYILRVCRTSLNPLSRKENLVAPHIICDLHSLINKLEAKELDKKEFIKKARKELNKWHD